VKKSVESPRGCPKKPPVSDGYGGVLSVVTPVSAAACARDRSVVGTVTVWGVE
jgi:hypothetical protein